MKDQKESLEATCGQHVEPPNRCLLSAATQIPHEVGLAPICHQGIEPGTMACGIGKCFKDASPVKIFLLPDIIGMNSIVNLEKLYKGQ